MIEFMIHINQIKRGNKRMLKKLILIIFIFTTIIFFTSSNGNKIKSVPYSIKCYKCYNETLPYSHSHIFSIAYRSFKDEQNPKYKGYCIYRCPHGHILYINYDTNERK